MMLHDEGGAALLAALVDQARLQGANLATLRALVETASEAGAARALHRVGLGDAGAGGDVRELRDLLDAWRGARRTAWRTVVRWTMTGLILALLVGLGLKLKFWPPAG